MGNAVYVGSSDGKIYRQCAPVVTGLSPSSGSAGDLVSITGANFGGAAPDSYVSFTGVEVTSPEAWTDSRIDVSVPPDASTGDVFVVTSQGTSNSMPFTIKAGPASAYNWYLAEGCTGKDDRGSFETWVLVQNPGSVPADVSSLS